MTDEQITQNFKKIEELKQKIMKIQWSMQGELFAKMARLYADGTASEDSQRSDEVVQSYCDFIELENKFLETEPREKLAEYVKEMCYDYYLHIINYMKVNSTQLEKRSGRSHSTRSYR